MTGEKQQNPQDPLPMSLLGWTRVRETQDACGELPCHTPLRSSLIGGGHIPWPCAGQSRRPCESAIGLYVSDLPANGGGSGARHALHTWYWLWWRGGGRGLRRRHGPGQGTGRLRAIAVAREAAGGMRGGRVACGFPSGGGKGEGRRGCSFFCSCWVLLILWSQVFFPSGGPEQVQRGWRAGASYYCCCWGSLRCVFPASGHRVCVCDVGRALSAPVKPWSEQARGLGSAHGRVQGLRIGWVEGMSHRPRGESVLLLAGVRGGGLGVEGRKGLRLGRTPSSLLGTVCREPVV